MLILIIILIIIASIFLWLTLFLLNCDEAREVQDRYELFTLEDVGIKK